MTKSYFCLMVPQLKCITEIDTVLPREDRNGFLTWVFFQEMGNNQVYPFKGVS